MKIPIYIERIDIPQVLYWSPRPLFQSANEELRRWERVIRICPNEASAVRLLGALLAEQHETWSTGKRYFDMTEYMEWKAAQAQRSLTALRGAS